MSATDEQRHAIDADERRMLQALLRHVIDSTPAHDVPAALLAEGWNELVETDPRAAITLVAEQAGAARSAAPVVDLAALWGAGVDPARTAFVYDGVATAGAITAERFVTAIGEHLVGVAADRATTTPIAGFDPELGLISVTLDTTNAEVLCDGLCAERAIAAGRRALASQMVGAVEQMLADTIEYVLARRQYGRQIGSFQSVKHRLADVKVAVSAARAATAAAWDASAGVDASTLAIAAKCLAGRAQQLASTHCFQVHGGIAFTVEHGFQQWVRRGVMLDLLLGPHEQLTAQLGRTLIATARVPRVPQL